MRVASGGKTYTVKWSHLVIENHPTIQHCTSSTISDDSSSFPIAFGMAWCSKSDQFIKAVGRKLSLTRALQEAKFDKTTRTAFWNAYLNRR